jgi:hypothetical protein
VTGDVEEAWRLELASIDAMPVTWDGNGYVLGEASDLPVLVAFDIRTGRELARARLPDEGGYAPRLVVGGDMVVTESERGLHGYSLRGGALRSRWHLERRAFRGEWVPPRDAVFVDNEVYARLGGSVFRIRPGDLAHVWRQEGSSSVSWARPNAVGCPAVRGRHVFQVFVDHSNAPTKGARQLRLRIVAIRRSDGTLAGERVIAEAWARFDHVDPVALTVDADRLSVRWAHGFPMKGRRNATHVIVPWSETPSGVSLAGELRFGNFVYEPVHHRLGWIVLLDEPGKYVWGLLRGDDLYGLVSVRQQPHLFRTPARPVILGDVAYFGAWAADLETRRILWKLPVESVTYGAVPADGLVLVVEGGKVLRAFRSRRHG